jgi:hypothetical protein
MPGKGHHTQKWHDCWEQVQSKGHDEGSAAAICTSSLEGAGEDIMAADAPADSGHGKMGKPFKKAKTLDAGLENYADLGVGHGHVGPNESHNFSQEALEAAGRMVGESLAYDEGIDLGASGSGPHKGFKAVAGSKRDRFHKHVQSLALEDKYTVAHGPFSSTYRTTDPAVAKQIHAAAGEKGHGHWTTVNGDSHSVHVRF